MAAAIPYISQRQTPTKTLRSKNGCGCTTSARVTDISPTCHFIICFNYHMQSRHLTDMFILRRLDEVTDMLPTFPRHTHKSKKYHYGTFMTTIYFICIYRYVEPITRKQPPSSKSLFAAPASSLGALPLLQPKRLRRVLPPVSALFRHIFACTLSEHICGEAETKEQQKSYRRTGNYMRSAAAAFTVSHPPAGNGAVL